MRRLISLLCLALVGLVQAISTTGDRLLVVLEESGEKSKYSKFWDDLQERGYKLTFESPKSEQLSLFRHGERAYDHLILLPPKSKGFGPALTAALLLDFLKSSGNILLTLSSTSPTPSAVTSFLLELDIHLPTDRTSVVVDHFNYDLSSEDAHDVLLLPRPQALRPDVRNFFTGPASDRIAFPHAVGQSLGPESPLTAPILRTPETAYTHNPKDSDSTADDTFATGSQLSLVSAMQARNSARVTVFGSLDALSNAWFDKKVKGPQKGAKEVKSVNRAFAREVSAWTFMEVGVLSVGKVEHHLKGDKEELNPSIYRVKNEVTFSIAISEHSLSGLTPFRVPENDALQLEFSMLSPFQRLALLPSKSSSNSSEQLYTATFTVPDQHGIFNFRVNYKRPFLSVVDEKKTVTVRHFAHDEWARSWNISGAWVWIAGIGATIFGWTGFVALWLWSEPTDKKKGAKKTQ